jgi:hypothetical protein
MDVIVSWVQSNTPHADKYRRSRSFKNLQIAPTNANQDACQTIPSVAALKMSQTVDNALRMSSYCPTDVGDCIEQATWLPATYATILIVPHFPADAKLGKSLSSLGTRTGLRPRFMCQ